MTDMLCGCDCHSLEIGRSQDNPCGRCAVAHAIRQARHADHSYLDRVDLFQRGRLEGMWGMVCFNALSAEQQDRVINHGNLAFPWIPMGDRCDNVAEVEVLTKFDRMPGPRYYCLRCGIEYLVQMRRAQLEDRLTTPSPDIEVSQ